MEISIHMRKRLFVCCMHSCIALRLLHTFIHPLVFPSIGRVIGNIIDFTRPFEFSHQLKEELVREIKSQAYSIKGEELEASQSSQKIRIARYREKPVSVINLKFLISRKFWLWSRGQHYLIKMKFHSVAQVLGLYPTVRSSIWVLYYSQLSTLFLWVRFMLSTLRSEVYCWLLMVDIPLVIIIPLFRDSERFDLD